MILVDTSVWIDFFRGVNSAEALRLVEALTAHEDLCICGPIVTEILQGIPSDTEYRSTRHFLAPFLYLPALRSTYYLAAELYRAARAKGKTIRNAVDCIIAACAIENHAEVLQRDNDFVAIAAVSKLNLVQCE